MKETKRECLCVHTFEIGHLLPLLSVALRVDPGFRVADLPRRREPRGRRGQQIPAYHAMFRNERDRLRRRRRALHSSL